MRNNPFIKSAAVSMLLGIAGFAVASMDAGSPTTHGLSKASAWIGMNVEDSAGGNVGEVKDLVVDWQQGKVSYAIVAIEKWLHIDGKLVAIAPDQLHVSPDGKHVVVAMTEAEVEAMPGFDDRALATATTHSATTHAAAKQPGSSGDSLDDADDTKRTY